MDSYRYAALTPVVSERPTVGSLEPELSTSQIRTSGAFAGWKGISHQLLDFWALSASGLCRCHHLAELLRPRRR
jgi:hypothetical protein